MNNRLESDRCVIRDITLDDTKDIVKWRSDPDVYKFFKCPKQITEEEHIDWYNNFYKKDLSRFDFIAMSKDTQSKIGIFSIKKNNNSIEISYLVDEKEQRKGYAREIINCLEDYAVMLWNIRYFIAEIHIENKKSICFIESNNFERIKQIGDFYIYGKKYDRN